jgi:putative nucleotidyltransferase with HDIG domain
MNRLTSDRSVWERAAIALDEDPGSSGFARAVHHGSRAVLLFFTAGLIFLLFPAPRLPDTAVLERGVVAPQDVIAEFTFDIPKDPDELLREQVEAASGVPPVYDLTPAAADSVLSGVRSFFATVDSLIARVEPDDRREVIRGFMEAHRITPTPTSVDILIQPRRRAQLQRSIETSVEELFPVGVAPSSLGEGVSTVRIRAPGGEERLAPRDSLLTPDRFYGRAADELGDATADAAELQRLILISFFTPSLVYNQAQTEGARERARAAVDPVQATVLRGERIVGAHEQIGDREIARLRAYQAELTARGMGPDGDIRTLGRSAGAILYNALVLAILGALIFFFRGDIYHNWRALTLFMMLVLSVAASGAVIARLDLPAELIPVTFAALIVAVLWDGRLGLLLALVIALLIAGQTPFLGVSAPFTVALGGAAAAFSVRVVERRSKTWLFISIISGAYILSAITMGMMRSMEPSEIILSMGWGVTNAIVASLLAIGFLPLIESFTRITTDQTLLELSDLNRKLLKRLSLEAPGTYAHTVNVANLAEAAAHAVGANGLLARVGSYYHDVGKLVKPQYFIENQPRGRNPHDKLKPSMSSAIIRSHVMEGLKLAESDRLPETVRRFIPEHHGTQQISFFYQKAREADPDGQLNPGDFSYPGPKPQIKETAILMLSDAVESATRVLQDPTPTRIRDLVERLVSQKIADGQLDQSPLTLREIDQIKESLATVLTGMYHHRIDYPTSPMPPPDREPEQVHQDSAEPTASRH